MIVMQNKLSLEYNPNLSLEDIEKNIKSAYKQSTLENSHPQLIIKLLIRLQFSLPSSLGKNIQV